jgi:uncharacterized protein (DUF885 family)
MVGGVMSFLVKGRLAGIVLALGSFAWVNSACAVNALSSSADARVKVLNDLLAEQWEYQLKESPELATIIGDYRYNDRWSDNSLAHAQQVRKEVADFLRRFESIDTTGFSEQDALNQQLMVRNLRDQLASFALKNEEMPLDQFNGTHLQLAQFVASIPFDTAKQYDEYLTRLHAIPKLIDTLIVTLKQGERDHLMPPKYLLEKVDKQARSIAQPAGTDNVFGMPARKFPDGASEAERKRLRDAIVAAVDREVRPAYVKLAKFVASDYAPKGRSAPGIWALPDGIDRYLYAVRVQTTTQKDPETIHQLGLAEVARIEGEMTVIAHKLGYADLKTFRAAMKDDPKVHASSRQQLIDQYTQYIAQMQPRLPELFGLLPKTRVEVRPVQEYRENEAAGAEYQQGTPDGSRPGVVYVNTGDFAHRSLLSVESTAYHEGVPGHHMQISIAQALPALPPFRQQAGYTGYVEGWALYSERLGKDVGFYQDPYSDYGRLSDELLRADRLVLDTGVHFKHWSREQMVSYFREHSSADEPDIQAETDRYIAWPGQALAYKLGQLKFLELRERAKQKLGTKFDIRAFHDQMLNGGALPLDVLEARFDAWLATQ